MSKLEITDDEFEKISKYIHEKLGIKLVKQKKSLLFMRLKPLVEKNNCSDFSEYYAKLKRDKTGTILEELTSNITTNHTYFMREKQHFEFFKNNIMPELYKKHELTKDLRIWCSASSYGQESYTIQMIIQDFFSVRQGNWNTRILATDVSTRALDIAVKGIYNTESLGDLPEEWKKKYFDYYDDENMIIKENIKREVIYRKFNLMEEEYKLKKGIQVIFCRNVIIYFDEETKDKIISKFYDLLDVGGYLFIGHSENLSKNNQFEYVAASVFRKI